MAECLANEIRNNGLEVALVDGQYRMKFHAVDDVTVTIDVHIRISDNVTGFYFHDYADEPGDVSPRSRFTRLRERLALEFGADSVSEGHSFLLPDGKDRFREPAEIRRQVRRGHAFGISRIALESVRYLEEKLYFDTWMHGMSLPCRKR